MARADRIAFNAGYRLAVIDVLLNGTVRLDLLVDTGSELTIISTPAAARLGLTTQLPRRRVSLVGIGRSSAAPVYRLASLQFGGLVANDVDVLVHDLPGEIRARGLLGVDILGRYRTTFDFRERVLVSRPLAMRRT